MVTEMLWVSLEGRSRTNSLRQRFHSQLCYQIVRYFCRTLYFIVLVIGSTCFGHYYAHHQELATIRLITTLVVSFCKDGGGSVIVNLCFLVVCVRCEFYINATPSIFRERNDQCGIQHYSRELLMMGIVVPETCWAYKKYNKAISSL